MSPAMIALLPPSLTLVVETIDERSMARNGMRLPHRAGVRAAG
jgi:hypothetical protein